MKMVNGSSVLFQDNHIIVCVKPYGVLSEHDDAKPNMPALLKEYCGCEKIYPIHRLDRTTQGLMVFAKTAEAAKRMSAAVQRGEVEKIYLAVVQGAPEEESGELSDLLYFDRRKNKSYVVKRDRRGVKQARLHYEVIGAKEYEGEQLSLLKVILLTGRTHQIRVQFASRRMSLVGDRRYGSGIHADNIMLCSSELKFTHPFTGEEMRFSFIPTNEYFGLFKEERQS